VAMEIAGSPYPASLQVDTPDRIARWRPLVQWFLAIPHMLVLYALEILSGVVAFISWFVVLFTGKLPESLAGLQAMYLRYSDRTLAYISFLVEEYPPFTFDTTGSDPRTYHGVLVDFEPELDHRNRLTVFFRLLLVIPHAIALFFVGIVAGIAHLIGFFAVLITGRWPEGLRNFVVGFFRWTLRVNAYHALLTDKYPPFSLS
jgi:hypothetical protein